MSHPVYRAIADPTRRHVLELLGDGERHVHELLEPFAISQPALSQHLRVLRTAGLVAAEPDGRRQRYRLTSGPLADVDTWLERFEPFWDERLDRLAHHLEKEA